MQALRAGIRLVGSSSVKSSSVLGGASPTISVFQHVDPVSGRMSVLGFVSGFRVFSQAAASVCSPSSYLDRYEVTNRVVELLKSTPFVDPAKVSPAASFDDLQLDTLDHVEVMMAMEEEFAVDIPNNEADKISTTAHLIDYIAAHPQAK